MYYAVCIPVKNHNILSIFSSKFLSILFSNGENSGEKPLKHWCMHRLDASIEEETKKQRRRKKQTTGVFNEIKKK